VALLSKQRVACRLGPVWGGSCSCRLGNQPLPCRNGSHAATMLIMDRMVDSGRALLIAIAMTASCSDEKRMSDAGPKGDAAPMLDANALDSGQTAAGANDAGQTSCPKTTSCDRIGLRSALNGAATIESVTATSLALRTVERGVVEFAWSGPSLLPEFDEGETVDVTVTQRLTTVRGSRATAVTYDHSGDIWALATPQFALPNNELLVGYSRSCSVMEVRCGVTLAYDTYELRARVADATVIAAPYQTTTIDDYRVTNVCNFDRRIVADPRAGCVVEPENRAVATVIYPTRVMGDD
jgi:hypothetical protein